ncbi:hypothetical protein H4R35_006238 [Dimargaris xerosporica]|nr:hypothetical protein H4R35_006238 [Dimargaris xerosporica]
MRLLSFAAIGCLLSALAYAATDDAEVNVFDESSSELYLPEGSVGASFNQEDGVQGVVAFTSEKGKAGTLDFMRVHIKVTEGLESRKSYRWYIFDSKVPKSGSCQGLKDHLDPYNVGQSSNYNCQRNDANSFRATCALGDMYGKFGPLNVKDEEGRYVGSFDDPTLALDGVNSVANHSIGIQDPKSSKVVACGNIKALTDGEITRFNAASTVSSYTALLTTAALAVGLASL